MRFGGWVKGVDQFSAEAGSESTFVPVGESG